MKLKIIGSGTAVPTKERASSCFLIEAGGKKLLFDIGTGAMKRLAEAGVDYKDIDHIFITHLHGDHINDLNALIFGYGYDFFHNPYYKPDKDKKLFIYGPKGVKEYADTIVKNLLFRKDYPVPTEIKELENDEFSIGKILIKTMKIRHHPKLNSIGYRVEADKKVLVYVGDSEKDENILELAKNADLVIMESSYNIKANGHLAPEEAADLAKKAGCKRLMLTHIFPKAGHKKILAKAKKLFKNTILAEDLKEVIV